MKKTISILLMVAMLLSVIVVTISAITVNNVAPVGGVNSSAVSISDVNTSKVDTNAIGNTVVDPEDNEAYVNSLVEQGYIPIVASTGKGKPSNAVTFDKIEDDKCYYLYEDIKWNKTIASNASGDTKIGTASFTEKEHPNGYLDDIIIDGCGHTIEVTTNLTDKSYNVTIKNVTFEGEIKDSKGDRRHHILGRWNSIGYSRFENITVNVNFSATNHTDAYEKSTGVLVYEANKGSYFKNICNNGSYEVGGTTTKMTYFGGLVGKAIETEFENVVNNGDIVVKAVTIDNTKAIGGIVAQATTCTIKNAVNTGDIILDGTKLTAAVQGIGGIVGTLTGGSIINGVSDGDIKISNGAKLPVEALGIGGVAGYVKNTDKISGFDCDGDIVLGAGEANGAIYVGGVLGHSDTNIVIEDCDRTGEITIAKGGVTCTVGGIVANVKAEKLEITNCSNEKDILFDGGTMGAPNDGGWGVGGIIGTSKSKNAEIANCVNNGNIISAPSTYASATGGIVGYQYLDEAKSLTVRNCVNNGNVGNINNNSMNGGVIGAIRGVVKASIQGCTNNGDVTTNINGKGWRTGVGGVIGVYGDVGNWMQDESKSLAIVCEILCCKNTGNVTGNCAAGGILGANREMALPIETITFNGCTNEGNVKTIDYVGSDKKVSVFNAAGIFAEPSGLGNVEMKYCVNRGEVKANNSASGILGTPIAQMISVTIENSKNSGKVDSVATAGGFIPMASNVTTLKVKTCFNEGEVITADTQGGIVAGIVGYTNKEASIDNCFNTGKMTSGKPSAAAPITHNFTVLAEDDVNFYTSGCVTATDVKHGTVKTAAEVAAAVEKILFERLNNPYALIDVINDALALYQQDYTPISWVYLTAAIKRGESVMNDPVVSQDLIDSAQEILEAKIAGLITVAPDYTAMDEKIKYAGTFKSRDYSSLTFIKVTNAVTAAEELKLDPNTLQSQADAAVVAIQTAIDGLEKRQQTEGQIDVGALGQLQVGGTLRPAQTKPVATEAPVETTDVPTEAPTEPVEEGGCGGIIGGAAVVLVAVAAIGVGVSLKKKED